MNALLFLPQYIRWHYTRALRDLWRNCVSMLLLIVEFFAFETIFSTFASSWIGAGRDTISNSVLSFCSRVIHAFIQIFLFLLGFGVLIAGIILASIVWVIWILYPCIIAATVAFAIVHFV